MENNKKEVRFLLDEEIKKELEKEAKKCDVPLASYIKSNIEEWKKKCQKKRKSLGSVQD